MLQLSPIHTTKRMYFHGDIIIGFIMWIISCAMSVLTFTLELLLVQICCNINDFVVLSQFIKLNFFALFNALSRVKRELRVNLWIKKVWTNQLKKIHMSHNQLPQKTSPYHIYLFRSSVFFKRSLYQLIKKIVIKISQNILFLKIKR